MFHAIRKQINPATAMAFVALVFATTGGAVAITGHNGGNGGANATAAKSKAKPKGKPGPRGPAGPKGETGAAGPNGPAGPAGPAGAKGETGAAGSAGAKGETGAAGTSGKDGASVESTALGEGEGGCNAGGSQFTVNGKTTTACNGEPGPEGKGGSGGLPKTLPAGETETGTFVAGFDGPMTGYYPTSISFPIPLSVPLVEETEVVSSYVTLEEQKHENGMTPPAECTGTAEKPTATKGHLCVYEGHEIPPENPAKEPQKTTVTFILRADDLEGKHFPRGVSTTGAVLGVTYTGPSGFVQLDGTWAVTAP